MRHPLRLAAIVLGAIAVVAHSGPPAQAEGGKVLVFAAASLKTALDAINAEFQKRTGNRVTVSYGASSALAKQIEQGAPADLFISADTNWMDYLVNRKLINTATRSDLLSNRLVLIAPKEAHTSVDIKPGFPLAFLLRQERLAMANTDAVPAGKYGKAALEALGVWESVKDRIAQADNVRAALLLVSRGEAALGIVYRSDAVSDERVAVIGTFPETTHPPIIYPVALLASSNRSDAKGFLDELRSPQARSIFENQGFILLN